MRTVQAVRISSDSVFEKLLLVSTFEKQREDYTEKTSRYKKIALSDDLKMFLFQVLNCITKCAIIRK